MCPTADSSLFFSFHLAEWVNINPSFLQLKIVCCGYRTLLTVKYSRQAVFAFCKALYELLWASTAMNINSKNRSKAL